MIKRNRTKIINTPTPESWEIILKDNLQAYQFLSQDFKNKLHDLMKVFIKEKNFQGCGISITEEIKVTIAAQACLLLLNKKHNYYPDLNNIFIYPSAFQSIQKEHLGYIVNHKKTTRSGESWVRGPIVLSWQDSLAGASNHQDGQNVVLHEFAHQLDQEDGRADGTPDLPPAMSYKTWARVMEKSFLQMAKLVSQNKKILLDEYGVTSPAEFFAVLTETFFEKPNQLNAQHHDLYELLKNYYGLDPIQWQMSNND